jgi:hypothetical protein
MLGWLIIVFPEGANSNYDSPEVVCRWETGLDGTDWLDEMAKDGRALMVNKSGYPCGYIMLRKDLLPELLVHPKPYNGTPVIGEDYVMEKCWWRSKQVNPEALAHCQPDTMMRVDAWDLS